MTDLPQPGDRIRHPYLPDTVCEVTATYPNGLFYYQYWWQPSTGGKRERCTGIGNYPVRDDERISP